MTMAEENLRNILQGIAEKEDYKLAKIDITPITSDSNYTTILYVATISEHLRPDLDLFAKVANMTEEIRAQNEVLMAVFKNEALFYSELALNFERMYNKNNVPVKDRLVIPKYYGHTATTGSETLVLENLVKKGFLNYDREKPLDWEYASTAVTELAKFHALGLALRDESPMEFEKLMTAFGPSFINNNISTAGVYCKAVAKGCEFVNDEYKSILEPYCNVEKYGKLLTAIAKKSTMLVFGDFRPSNLMHRWRNGQLEIITQDYQTLSLGNPVVDLMYFIFSASDEEFRRLNYQRLLDHYFSQLTIALKHLNVDVAKVYSRKTFEDDVKEPFGVYTGFVIVPLALLDPKDAPEDPTDLDGFLVEPNKQAVERINGIVSDFVKWGVI